MTAPLPPQFAHALAEFTRLRSAFDSGTLPAAQFAAAMDDLAFQYEGRLWTIGANSGTWFVHEGRNWVDALPPAAAAPPPPPPPPAPPPPPPAVSAWRPTHRVGAQGAVAFARLGDSQPVARLDPWLEIQVIEVHPSGWSHVVCSNTWSAWIDQRALQSWH